MARSTHTKKVRTKLIGWWRKRMWKMWQFLWLVLVVSSFAFSVGRVFGPRSVAACVCVCVCLCEEEVATASSTSNITSNSGTATFYGILLIKIFNMICTTWVSVGLTLVWLCAKTHFFWATSLSPPLSSSRPFSLPCSSLQRHWWWQRQRWHNC